MTADAAIFFDLDGTLVQFTRPYGDVIADALRAHLGEAPDDLVATYDETFYEAFADFAPDPYREGMVAVLEAADADTGAGVDSGVGSDPEAAPGREPAAGPGRDLEAGPDPDAMVATLREEEYRATSIDGSLRGSLERLGEDAALGVLTNGLTEWQVGKLERHGLAAQFDVILASYEAGAHKPDPAPFELAAERLPADEYAMVGDDDADVEGARAAGWVPIRYEDDGEGPAFWETVGALL